MESRGQDEREFEDGRATRDVPMAMNMRTATGKSLFPGWRKLLLALAAAAEALAEAELAEALETATLD